MQIFIFFLKNSDARKQGSDAWRRPMIIKGLGIVSKIELCFFIMFIALLAWSFSVYVKIRFAKITAKSAAMWGETV